jgi:hypothetical protein
MQRIASHFIKRTTRHLIQSSSSSTLKSISVASSLALIPATVYTLYQRNVLFAQEEAHYPPTIETNEKAISLMKKYEQDPDYVRIMHPQSLPDAPSRHFLRSKKQGTSGVKKYVCVCVQIYSILIVMNQI